MLIDGVHRYTALLAVLFLVVHILTAVLDPFAPIGLADAVVPFVGAYRPLWLGLGAVAFDLLLAVGLTSILRARIGHRAWRIVHWAAYGSWPVAVIHGLATGSDVRQSWMAVVYLACATAALGAVVARCLGVRQAGRGRRAFVLSAVLVYVAGVAIWLPLGPLGRDWATRSGTPSRLLAPAQPQPSRS
jgi:predicted ferric reductase